MTSTITLEQLDEIQQALYEQDVFMVYRDDPETDSADGEWYLNYSGRAMYGSTCLGVVTGDPYGFMLKLGIALGRMETDSDWVPDLVDDFFNIRTDNMGRSATIVYFPNVEVDRVHQLTQEEEEAERHDS